MGVSGWSRLFPHTLADLRRLQAPTYYKRCDEGDGMVTRDPRTRSQPTGQDCDNDTSLTSLTRSWFFSIGGSYRQFDNCRRHIYTYFVRAEYLRSLWNRFYTAGDCACVHLQRTPLVLQAVLNSLSVDVMQSLYTAHHPTAVRRLFVSRLVIPQWVNVSVADTGIGDAINCCTLGH